MRHKILPVIILLLLLAGCAVQKETGGQYDFPAAMTEAVRASYTEQCEKGRVLYEANCARCHNKVVKGRQVVPYFPMDKLIGYALRESNERHTSNLPEEKVTTEDLGLIMTFLTYNKQKK